MRRHIAMTVTLRLLLRPNPRPRHEPRPREKPHPQQLSSIDLHSLSPDSLHRNTVILSRPQGGEGSERRHDSGLKPRTHNRANRCNATQTQKRVAGRSSRSSRQSRKSYFFFELGFFFVIHSGLKFGFSQSNNPNKSPNAGLFTGTYALAALDFGSGKLSRLRLVIVGKLQFRSMNFTSETWS
jgi:hypothetical protein